MAARRDRFLLYAAAFLRAYGVGLCGVLLGVYLDKLGYDAVGVGMVVALGLAGVAGGTAAVGLWADRAGRRATLIVLSLLAATGGLLVATGSGLAVLAAGAFLGMANGTGRDRGAAYSVEQAVLPATASDDRRTAVFAAYNLVLEGGTALGSLSAGLPFILREAAGIGETLSYRAVVALYAVVGVGSAALYLGLSRAVELAGPIAKAGLSPASRKVVARLTGLFAIDALGGGFVGGTILAYWFFRRFGLGEEYLGPIFAVARVGGMLSSPAAAWLARRIGLINTMVWTHIPSSLVLIAIPFVPLRLLAVAVALYILREFLSQMDVPTRQSYVMAVVAPEERTAAAGVTNLVRPAAWAVGPWIAGWAMKVVALGVPLFVGAGLKITYDLLLWASFRRLKPPEERAGGD